jgi:hypothetical protein
VSQRGNKPAEQPGKHGQCKRKGHHLPVKSDGAHARQRLREQADAHTQRCCRKAETENAAAQTQQQRLNQRSSQHRQPACAQGKPDRDLAAAAKHAHQQQPRQVGAGDEQHHQDCKKQCAHERPRLAHRVLIQRLDRRMNAAAR